MSDLAQGVIEAARLLLAGDRELWAIVGRTLAISGLATLFAMLLGVPAGYALARGRFRGRTAMLALMNTGMGMPPVVVCLIVWLLLTRSGPFGAYGSPLSWDGAVRTLVRRCESNLEVGAEARHCDIRLWRPDRASRTPSVRCRPAYLDR